MLIIPESTFTLKYKDNSHKELYILLVAYIIPMYQLLNKCVPKTYHNVLNGSI